MADDVVEPTGGDDPKPMSLAAYKAARAAGHTDADIQAEGYALPTTNPIESALRSVWNGVTLGAGNKITALDRAATPQILGGPRGFPYEEMLADENAKSEAFRAVHPYSDAVLGGVGSIAPVVAAAPYTAVNAATRAGRIWQVMKHGGAFGTVQGALSSDHLADVPSNVARNAALGAVIAPVAAGVGHVAGNLAGRVGLSTAASDLLAGRGGAVGDVAEALGARGAVNQAAGPRVALAEQLRAPGPSAQALLNTHWEQGQAEAKVLYDAMRADKTIVNDPEVAAILKEPLFEKYYGQIVKNRARAGDPVPSVIDPNHVPKGFENIGITPEALARVMGRSTVPENSNFPSDVAARTAKSGFAEQLATMPKLLAGDMRVDVPDPQALHTLKKVANGALNGYMDSRVPMKQEEAQTLMPMLRDLTDRLHAVSPPARIADAHYANFMGRHEAMGQAAELAGKGTNTTGDYAPESIAESIANKRYPMEPDAAQQARGGAFREAGKASVMDKVGQSAIETPRDILKANLLDLSPQAAKARANLFSDPAEHASFEQWLAQQHGMAADMPKTNGNNGMTPTSGVGVARRLVRVLLKPEDLVQTGAGQRIAGQYANDPEAMGRGVLAASRGSQILEALARMGVNVASLQGERVQRAMVP